jgi:hypothetical protein
MSKRAKTTTLIAAIKTKNDDENNDDETAALRPMAKDKNEDEVKVEKAK